MNEPDDPLCEFPDERLYGAFCQCRLIGRARADERERISVWRCPDCASVFPEHTCHMRGGWVTRPVVTVALPEHAP